MVFFLFCFFFVVVFFVLFLVSLYDMYPRVVVWLNGGCFIWNCSFCCVEYKVGDAVNISVDIILRFFFYSNMFDSDRIAFLFIIVGQFIVPYLSSK